MFAIFANVLFFFKGFVFLLQLFFSLCQFLSQPDCSFAAELTITLYNKVWMQEEGGSGVPEM